MRGGGLDLLYEQDVIVKDDLVESVRPRQPTTDSRVDASLSVWNVMIDCEWKVRDGDLVFDDEARLKSRGGAAAKKIWDQLDRDGFFVKMPR
jgi:hypothetical protein